MKGILAVMLCGMFALAGCGRASADYDPKAIESKYGLTGAVVEDIMTEQGKVRATVVPTVLEDGRKVQLIIPHEPIDDEHQVFMRDGIEITPLALSDKKLTKQAFVESQPRVIERRPTAAAATAPAAPAATTQKKKRSVGKEVLIVGGSAGAGAAIGAIAGGGKGAAIGGLSGGVAGLVYDLATRNKK
jgi:hypothetical protein